ncbi:MAG TPA: DUF3793 family protein [Clostridiales bacterium]|nr:DUF3793 family protein [Clostridiales bacterium]
MSEELLVQHCSPTLAGMKTGSLFSLQFDDDTELRNCIRCWNHLLGKKGLRVLPLRTRHHRALIYVYRPSKLSADLQQTEACKLLEERGYSTENPSCCLAQLRRHLEKDADFPHEIGLFLGYPPEDVDGFIRNQAEGCKCVGCWKVYGNEAEAEKTFAKFKKCTAVYCAQFQKGKSIERLTVAG